ncbi:CamS family sex pheromone protein [Virgibacillus oceani]|uniref:Lipoprotein YerH n=1 Tax=Virgibacillus oceani TaxID=1479511 RepID=A0A917HC73_9BACI|nr:CamS family sex pheromone protein [Virgibacillus oceani]GGG74202.1 putative lipoprotein YerH [Virgibacillus oceani]
MKKIYVLLVCTLLLMTGCAPNMNEDEVVQKNDEKANQERSIVPSYRLSEENYKMILPYRPSAARGVITNQMGNRVDIDEMEEGLRRHSKAIFDPEKYYFEEGQYLTEDMVYDWLGRMPNKEELEEMVKEKVKRLEDDGHNVDEEDKEKIRKDLQQGLNPKLDDLDLEGLDKDAKKEKEIENQRENPRYLSHILEQNFLKKNEDKSAELVGVSIGIALKSVYRFQTEIGGPYYYEDISKDKMLKQGKKVAQTILKRVRQIEELKNVPIMIALYREEDQGSPVPGNYVAKTAVKGGVTEIDEWNAIGEEYILFPSDEGEEKYYDDSQLVDNFGKEIQEYFPNYVGVIGEGFYIKEELKKLTLTVPIEFYGKGEVIGFTQYAYGLVKEMFPDYYDLEIKIKSNDKLESLIYRNAGVDDPTVHILH